MELKSIKLKDCIFEIDTRNTNLEVNNLLGVTINKVFIPSVANINGTDLSKYKLINKNQFVCGLMQVSRDEGVAIALYKNNDKAIVSPAYYVFEVLSDVVLPEYLELIFCSSEFDREATFNAVGGVRGTLTWEDFCNIEISIPSLDEQKKFVRQYNTIVNRINVLERLNEKLNVFGDTLFQKYSLSESKHSYKLSDLTTVCTGKKDANEADGYGNYPFFTCSKEFLWTNSFSYSGEAVLVSGNGDIDVKYYNGCFEAYQRTYILMPTDSRYTAWLYFGLKSKLSSLTRDSKGSVISYLTKGSLENITWYCSEELNETLLNNFRNIVSHIAKNNTEIILMKKIQHCLLSSM